MNNKLAALQLDQRVCRNFPILFYMQACSEYVKSGQWQGRKWQKAILYEKEQRQRLEKVVEELAKQHTKLEEAAATAVHQGT